MTSSGTPQSKSTHLSNSVYHTVENKGSQSRVILIQAEEHFQTVQRLSPVDKFPQTATKKQVPNSSSCTLTVHTVFCESCSLRSGRALQLKARRARKQAGIQSQRLPLGTSVSLSTSESDGIAFLRFIRKTSSSLSLPLADSKEQSQEVYIVTCKLYEETAPFMLPGLVQQ